VRWRSINRYIFIIKAYLDNWWSPSCLEALLLVDLYCENAEPRDGENHVFEYIYIYIYIYIYTYIYIYIFYIRIGNTNGIVEEKKIILDYKIQWSILNEDRLLKLVICYIVGNKMWLKLNKFDSKKEWIEQEEIWAKCAPLYTSGWGCYLKWDLHVQLWGRSDTTNY